MSLILTRKYLALLAAVVAAVSLAACARADTHSVPAVATMIARAVNVARHATRQTRIDHVTIVIMENRSFEDIIGNDQAPYINRLAKSGLLLTNSYAVRHPSEPNYLALYSGSTQGLDSDACPVHYNVPSLGGIAIGAHASVKGYMEDIPAVGSAVCKAGLYVRKHNPLIDFSDTPANVNVPYMQISIDMRSNRYPDIAFVVPNLVNDMHDGTIATGDAWLANHLPPLLAFNGSHKGILILTWDEDDHSANNHIPTIVLGPMLKPSRSDQVINHYSVLRTVTELFNLPALNNATPISAVTR